MLVSQLAQGETVMLDVGESTCPEEEHSLLLVSLRSNQREQSLMSLSLRVQKNILSCW